MYLVKDDLLTHIYSESIEEITREDDTIVERAISAAIAEAKSYLSRYDLALLFADDADDENLRNKVKDLACWHLIKLSNPNIDVAMFRTAYEDARRWLEGVMKGQVDPAGWPRKANDPETGFPEGGAVGHSSNTKRVNHF